MPADPPPGTEPHSADQLDASGGETGRAAPRMPAEHTGHEMAAEKPRPAGMPMATRGSTDGAPPDHEMSSMPASTTSKASAPAGKMADHQKSGTTPASMPGMSMSTAENSGSAMARSEMGEMPGMEMEQDKGPVWAHFVSIMILGIWLITSPFAMNYGDTRLLWSDIISGALMITLAGVTLVRQPVWAPWANSLVGVWLLFAPLVFSARTAGAYANDTLIGALLITFAILMPGMPGMAGMKDMLPGPDRPPGWSYNPSSWPQRAPVIALAFVGFVMSRQMAAYQLGYTDSVWEPFFDPGTVAVLTSDVSRAFPISDAGFGGVAYMLEGLMGFMGGKDRWRTMPWMVTFFGILVVPLGIVSVGLIILQPIAVGAWCTPCLIAALAMLVMIALTLDEVVAMGQFLVQARREGQSLWRVFWRGGSLAEAAPDDRIFHPDVISPKAMAWGVALPWNLIISVALGLWLMSAPSALGSTGYAAHSDHLVGALVVTVAIMALADVGRPLRFINILFGAWFLIAPWVLDGAATGATLNDLVVGVALIVLSLPRGPIGERYGSYERFIR